VVSEILLLNLSLFISELLKSKVYIVSNNNTNPHTSESRWWRLKGRNSAVRLCNI